MVVFFNIGVKINIKPFGGLFDVSQENDRTSPNVKTPLLINAFSAWALLTSRTPVTRSPLPEHAPHFRFPSAEGPDAHTSRGVTMVITRR